MYSPSGSPFRAYLPSESVTVQKRSVPEPGLPLPVRRSGAATIVTPATIPAAPTRFSAPKPKRARAPKKED